MTCNHEMLATISEPVICPLLAVCFSNTL
jgi:hypothetical protein